MEGLARPRAMAVVGSPQPLAHTPTRLDRPRPS